MYLWPFLERLWLLFPIFFTQTMKSIKKDLSWFWRGNYRPKFWSPNWRYFRWFYFRRYLHCSGATWVIPWESHPLSVIPFIKVKDSFEWPAEMIDDYENVIAPGLRYTGGRFMKKVDDLVKGFLYELSKKKTLFFKESVVHPFVQFKGHKKGIFFSMKSTLKYWTRLAVMDSLKFK